MATDKLFYEYAMLFPNAMARFVEAEPDDYVAKSLTFKQIERRADIFLIGRSGQHVVLVEPQGYKNRELYYDMLIKIALFCKQNKYRGKIDAIALFLNESHFQAAEVFNQQFENSNLVRFTPKVFVFIKMEDTPLGQEILRMGEKRGIEKGIQHVLLKLIATRFGVVPKEIRRRVEAISNTDDLDRIAAALLTIQSMDELKNLVN